MRSSSTRRVRSVTYRSRAVLRRVAKKFFKPSFLGGRCRSLVMRWHRPSRRLGPWRMRTKNTLNSTPSSSFSHRRRFRSRYRDFSRPYVGRAYSVSKCVQTAGIGEHGVSGYALVWSPHEEDVSGNVARERSRGTIIRQRQLLRYNLLPCPQ